MSKYSKELIIKACKEYVTGMVSFDEICSKYRINPNSLKDWGSQFISCGEASFIKTPGNARYTSDFKIQVVEEYISRAGFIRNICYKYQIPSTYTLRKWISLYNANRELKDYCQRFYSEGRPQDRFHCQTPLEVRKAALLTDKPVEYPIPENKRIKKYKEKWCA